MVEEIIKKTIEDCRFNIALTWAVSAESSFCNVNRYIPNQVVFRRNPKLSTFCDCISTSEILTNNPNTMYSARKSFLECKSSEKLRQSSPLSETVYYNLIMQEI